MLNCEAMQLFCQHNNILNLINFCYRPLQMAINYHFKLRQLSLLAIFNRSVVYRRARARACNWQLHIRYLAVFPSHIFCQCCWASAVFSFVCGSINFLQFSWFIRFSGWYCCLLFWVGARFFFVCRACLCRSISFRSRTRFGAHNLCCFTISWHAKCSFPESTFVNAMHQNH